MLLSELIEQSAHGFSDKPALISPNGSLSFNALNRQSNQVASRLRHLQIGPGSRVAMVHENALAAVIFYWGILKAGAQVVDVPCLAGVETISDILFESTPAALVTSERQVRRLLAAGTAALPRVVLMESLPEDISNTREYHSLAEITSSEEAEISPTGGHDCDVAIIVYTSGTTGRPKGVMLSHRNLLSNICAANSLIRLDSSDSILVLVPLYFIHGRMQLLTHALIGGTVVLSAGFQFPQQVVDELARYRVTGFSGVPYHFSTLIERTNLTSSNLPDLRYMLITGGAMPPDALQRLSAALPKVEIHIAYGQTEASPRITYLGPSGILDRANSSGQSLPGIRVEIVGEDGAAVPTGSVGEIVASGPNIMCGYVSGDEFTSGKIDAFGRLHTGDLGRLNDEGYLYIVGRKSELIKSAGERIFPKEIEAVLDAHPAIREAAVLGIQDRVLGEKIVACVVPQSDINIRPEDIRTHCLKFLPLVRVPREVRFSKGLPKTGSGKIDRHALIDHFNELGVAVRAA